MSEREERTPVEKARLIKEVLEEIYPGTKLNAVVIEEMCDETEGTGESDAE